MSCYKPIRILNPTLEPTLRDKVFLEVPCGKCENCRKRKRNDYFVRLVAEYEDVIRCNGTAFFFTLTYNNDNLPFYEDIPCFSLDDIQKYLKRIRTYAFRKFNIPLKTIKYFITSEVGDKYNRPHYHGILFVRYPLDATQRYLFKEEIVRACWHHGFVNFGRKLEGVKEKGVIQSPAALRYVVKYVTKYSDRYDKRNCDIDSRHAPRVYCSHGIGLSLVNSIGLKHYDYLVRYMIDGTVTLKGFTKPYAIPQYVTRKILYDYIYDKDTQSVSWKLNDIGIEVKKVREYYSAQYQLERFEGCFKNILDLDLKYYDRFIDRLPKIFQFDTSDELSHYVSLWNNLSKLEKTDFILYTTFTRDRVCVPTQNYYDDGRLLDFNDMFMILDNLYSNDVYSYERVGLLYEADMPFKSKVDDLMRHTYAFSPGLERSALYDIFISIFNAYNYYIGYCNEVYQNEEFAKYENAKLLIEETI